MCPNIWNMHIVPRNVWNSYFHFMVFISMVRWNKVPQKSWGHGLFFLSNEKVLFAPRVGTKDENQKREWGLKL